MDDSVAQYVAARAALRKRQRDLTEELRRVNEALSEEPGSELPVEKKARTANGVSTGITGYCRDQLARLNWPTAAELHAGSAAFSLDNIRSALSHLYREKQARKRQGKDGLLRWALPEEKRGPYPGVASFCRDQMRGVANPMSAMEVRGRSETLSLDQVRSALDAMYRAGRLERVPGPPWRYRLLKETATENDEIPIDDEVAPVADAPADPGANVAGSPAS